MKNNSRHKSKVANILLSELSVDMIGKLGLSPKWHQVFLKAGQEVKSRTITADELSLSALYTPKGLAILECLWCNTLFTIRGHCSDQPQQVVHRVDTDGIKEWTFRCSAACNLETDSTWTCLKCGNFNPYHLTMGSCFVR
jgi:hypothetical protein